MYRILLVENESVIRRGIADTIDWEQLNFCIAGEASDGREALERLNRGEAFDVLVTDVCMPEMDGLTLLKTLKAQGNAIPAVIISGYDDFSYAKQAMECNVFAYLLKPCRQDEIADTFLRLAQQLDSETEQRMKIERLQRSEGILRLYENNRTLFNALRSGADDGVPKALCLLHVSDGFSGTAYAAYDHYIHNCSGDDKLYGLTPINDHHIAALSHQIDNAGAIFEQFRLKLAEASNQYLSSDGLSAKVTGAWAVSDGRLDELSSRVYGLLDLRLFYGVNCLYEESQMQKHLASRTHEDAALNELCESIARACAANPFDQVERLTVRYFNLVRNSAVSQRDVYAAASKLLNSVSGAIGRMEHANIDPYRELIGIVENGTIIDIVEWALALFELFMKQNGSFAEDDYNAEIIKAAIKRIEEGYMSQITLQEVANSFFMSASYFSLLFKRHTGETFVRYLTNVRMRKARELLRRDYKVYEVAGLVGYDDYRYFSRVFLKTVGVKPNEFKAKGSS